MSDSPRIRIDPASDLPVARQIADNLRVLLVEGKLTPGTSLPPVRRVAMELGVHFNTVAEAYRKLAAEGWLDLKHGRGANVVSRTAPEIPLEEWSGDFRVRLRQMVAELRSKGVSVRHIADELRDLEQAISQKVVP